MEMTRRGFLKLGLGAAAIAIVPNIVHSDIFLTPEDKFEARLRSGESIVGESFEFNRQIDWSSDVSYIVDSCVFNIKNAEYYIYFSKSTLVDSPIAISNCSFSGIEV